MLYHVLAIVINYLKIHGLKYKVTMLTVDRRFEAFKIIFANFIINFIRFKVPISSRERERGNAKKERERWGITLHVV